MFEQLILGSIQGIAEWLPVSSEGMIILAKTNFFSQGQSISELIKYVLLLHFGTFLAVLVYFWNDVKKLTTALFKFKDADAETQQILKFLIISTVVSSIVGLTLLRAAVEFGRYVNMNSRLIMLVIGLFLFLTGILQMYARRTGHRSANNLRLSDCILLGIVQGFAALPGLSRSGLTISAFLLRKYEKTFALRLSFLMSLPAVFLGNLVLNCNCFSFKPQALLGIAASFIFGLLTIHLFLKISRKIHFEYFVLVFATLTLIAAL